MRHGPTSDLEYMPPFPPNSTASSSEEVPPVLPLLLASQSLPLSSLLVFSRLVSGVQTMTRSTFQPSLAKASCNQSTTGNTSLNHSNTATTDNMLGHEERSSVDLVH